METLLAQGAESRVYLSKLFGNPVVVKERFSKKYRHAKLDVSLTHKRFLQEARNLVKVRKLGVPVPAVLFLDEVNKRMYMELITPAITVKEFLAKMPQMSERLLDDLATKIASAIAKIHEIKCIHGDLTSSNLLIKPDNLENATSEEILRAVESAQNVGKLYLIDFGLSFVSGLPEDKAVDLYCLERALLSTHQDSDALFQKILVHYRRGSHQGDPVLKRLVQVRLRGRKRLAFG